MILSIIVAMGRNRVIGVDNGLPWHLSADLKHFKAVTMGKPVIMGRKTFESIGKPLPGRTNIVLTRDGDFSADGVTVVHGLEEALAAAQGMATAEAFIIGGAEIYGAALTLATRIHMTEVDLAPAGDAYFPSLSEKWRAVAREEHPSVGDAPAYAFVIYERVSRGEITR